MTSMSENRHPLPVVYRNEIQPGKAIFPPNQHCVVCGSSEWAGVVAFPWEAGQHISVGDPGYDRRATFDVFLLWLEVTRASDTPVPFQSTHAL